MYTCVSKKYSIFIASWLLRNAISKNVILGYDDLEPMSGLLLLLKGAATRCNTLQHTATRCSTLQHTATQCNTLQHTATRCNTLQHTATHYSTLQHNAFEPGMQHHAFVWLTHRIQQAPSHTAFNTHLSAAAAAHTCLHTTATHSYISAFVWLTHPRVTDTPMCELLLLLKGACWMQHGTREYIYMYRFMFIHMHIHMYTGFV